MTQKSGEVRGVMEGLSHPVSTRRVGRTCMTVMTLRKALNIPPRRCSEPLTICHSLEGV